MRIIYNKFLPAKGFGLMNILGLVFSRIQKGAVSNSSIRHEAIHTAQQYEILALSALIALVLSNVYSSWWYLLIVVAMPIAIYILAWLIELALPPYNSAYKDSPFEREAYANQYNEEYLATRKLFAWVKYILWNRNKK